MEKTIENLCKEAFIEATGIYKNVPAKEWWPEFKSRYDLDESPSLQANDREKQLEDALRELVELARLKFTFEPWADEMKEYNKRYGIAWKTARELLK